MTVMAILQEVDKCMRCNGCVIACKREWNMKSETIGVHKVSYDQRLAIKSQKRVDMGPFLRFTCWHCPSPPCASACPYDAIIKRDNGAVDVDETLCRPDLCRRNGQYPCVVGCQRGGYPKVGVGRTTQVGPKANKCTLCSGRAGDVAPEVPNSLPSRNVTGNTSTLVGVGVDNTTVYPDLGHEPACVASCPAKAMVWDTQANIKAYLSDPANGYVWANGTRNWIGNGSMFWGSKKVLLAPPKADPLVEDHVSPLTSDFTIGALGLAPAVLLTGMWAYSSHRARTEEEAAARGEV